MTARKRISRFIADHRALTVGIAALAVAIAAVVTILVWPGSPTTTPRVAYTNISRNYKTCLLTTAQNAAQAAPVWKALQNATTRAPINAQQLTATDGATDQLTPYFNTLIALHCQLIVTTGTDLTDALTTVASSNPRSHFLNIGTAINRPNIHTIPTPLTNPDTITTYIFNSADGKY